jgi:hypothetical protein
LGLILFQRAVLIIAVADNTAVVVVAVEELVDGGY